MSKNKSNNLYVFVKGNKGKGAFEITDSEFKPVHSAIVNENNISPHLMDLKAIEMSLEYIRDNRGKDGLPDQPVTFIFTTFENNYHIAAELKEPKEHNTIKFKKRFDKLKNALLRDGMDSHDEVKCYWIPDNFENRIEDVKKLLTENINKFKP
jgi:hypothetical protein